MKSFLSLLFLSSLLFSYEKGDTLSPQMLSKLELTSNKIYIIDFFASWCSSCKKEIPLISKANRAIDITKAEIIGIDVDKNQAKAQAFQKELKDNNNLNFRVINDPDNIIISEFNPLGMPTLFYVKDKVIIKITTGAVANIDEEILLTIKNSY